MRTVLRKAHSVSGALAASLLMIVVLPIMAPSPAFGQTSARDLQWTRFDIPANGVSLRVPLGVFEAQPAEAEAQGRLFTARDGQSRLLVGAFENIDNSSPAAYQKYVISSSYPSAAIDYAPLRRTWFVVSGTMNSLTFYQRVTFTCGGRLINSWAMLYPTAQKSFYDGLVDQMHRSFQAGRGPTGDCRLDPATN